MENFSGGLKLILEDTLERVEIENMWKGGQFLRNEKRHKKESRFLAGRVIFAALQHRGHGLAGLFCLFLENLVGIYQKDTNRQA